MKIFLRFLLSLPAIIITIGIFFASDVEQAPFSLTFDFGDKILHFSAYFLYGFSLVPFMKLNFRNWSKKKVVTVVAFFGSIYAFSDEIHQYFVPGRSCEFSDWLADFIGIAAALLFTAFIFKLMRKLNFD